MSEAYIVQFVTKDLKPKKEKKNLGHILADELQCCHF